MKRTISNVWFILLAAFVMGCASRPVFRVASVEDGIEYYQGREVASKEDDYALTTVEFEDQAEDNFVFFIQVLNKSGEPITFHPEDVSMELLDGHMESLNNRAVHYALDPEQKLEMLNNEIKNRDDWHKTATGLNIVFGLINVVTDLADNDSHDDAFEVAEDVAIFADNQIRENIDHEMTVNDLNAQKEFWKNEVLRVTTLHNEELIGGLVFIPFNPDARFVRINIPAGETYHTYLFKQIQIN